jgi:hypothetical protein
MNIQGAIPCGGDYAPLPPVEGGGSMLRNGFI